MYLDALKLILRGAQWLSGAESARHEYEGSLVQAIPKALGCDLNPFKLNGLAYPYK